MPPPRIDNSAASIRNLSLVPATVSEVHLALLAWTACSSSVRSRRRAASSAEGAAALFDVLLMPAMWRLAGRISRRPIGVQISCGYSTVSIAPHFATHAVKPTRPSAGIRGEGVYPTIYFPACRRSADNMSTSLSEMLSASQQSRHRGRARSPQPARQLSTARVTEVPRIVGEVDVVHLDGPWRATAPRANYGPSRRFAYRNRTYDWA